MTSRSSIGLRVGVLGAGAALALALVIAGCTSRSAVAADAVVGFHTLDDMNRERNLGDPRFSVPFIFQVELSGRRIVDMGLCTQVVYRLDQ